MYYYSKQNKKKWQRKFIRNVFEKRTKYERKYSNIILKNLELLEEKNDYLPNSLFKYYTPTSDNILDIKNKRLWLSHPSQFNDPFDCNFGFDKDKYEKKCFLDYINKNGTVSENKKTTGFTEQDKNRILRSFSEELDYFNPKIESYFDAKHKILEEKQSKIKQEVGNYLHNKTKDLDFIVENLKSIDIRITCFSNFDKYDEFNKQIVMWAHYAENHKGFCVEYDLSSFRNSIEFSIEDYKFYNNKEEYLTERNKAIIKAGLFPVEYTAKRINIPVSKLRKINNLNATDYMSKVDIDEIIYKAYVVKSANWNYEKEWRIIIDDKVSKYYDNKIPFPYAKKIYLGCKADNGLIDTMMKIGEEIGVDVAMLKMDNKKFVLEDIGTWEYKYKKELKTIDNPYK